MAEERKKGWLERRIGPTINWLDRKMNPEKFPSEIIPFQGFPENNFKEFMKGLKNTSGVMSEPTNRLYHTWAEAGPFVKSFRRENNAPISWAREIQKKKDQQQYANYKNTRLLAGDVEPGQLNILQRGERKAKELQPWNVRLAAEAKMKSPNYFSNSSYPMPYWSRALNAPKSYAAETSPSGNWGPLPEAVLPSKIAPGIPEFKPPVSNQPVSPLVKKEPIVGKFVPRFQGVGSIPILPFKKEPIKGTNIKSNDALSAARKLKPAEFVNVSDVKRLQMKLNAAGANLKVDGDWGPETQAAYQKYQSNLTAVKPTESTLTMGQIEPTSFLDQFTRNLSLIDTSKRFTPQTKVKL